MITQDLLKSRFSYSEEKMGLVYKKTINYMAKEGSLAGKIVGSYRRISVNKKTICMHRAVWLFFYGYQPDKHIDHINGIRDDNRISNLREASNAENAQNLKSSHKDALSKYLGVSWVKKARKWRAQICIDGKNKSLGYFDNEIEAYESYLSEKRKIHKFCTL